MGNNRPPVPDPKATEASQAFNAIAAIPPNGFSLAQVLVSIAVLGVLGGLAVSRWAQTGRRQALILEGKTLRSFLQEARAYGAKKNLQVGVKFDASGSGYRLFEDRDGDGALDNGEAVRTLALGKGIAFGIAANGPATGPDLASVPASGLAGSWATAWTAPIDLGTAPSQGGLYLRHSQLPRVCVNLRLPAGSREYIVSMWNGSAWVGL